MARADKVEVVLSSTDRQLLRDIRDALRALSVKPEDEGSAPGAVRRIVESASDEWDYRFLDDHIDADTKGYTWNGSGWVPKG